MFEIPFLASFGLLLCAGCAFAARQLAASGAERLARIARFAVIFGLLAALSDLIQNSAAVILTGHFAQPAPRLSEVFGWTLQPEAALVVQAVAGSNPVVHPSQKCLQMAPSFSGRVSYST